MLDGGWGRIVNVSSGIAARPSVMVGANAYATSKAALRAHPLNLAAGLHDSRVTVNGYRPGDVDTAMQAWIPTSRWTSSAKVYATASSPLKESGTLLVLRHQLRGCFLGSRLARRE
jgi:NAD(P)-dependent dehydrogenase (short-subunit alcohol dehydrogenase family)